MNRKRVESCYAPAALEALESFPVDAQDVELVAQSENVTFRVSDRRSESDYVLRLHRPGYNSIQELNSERVWIQGLMDSGLSVPGSLLTHDGKHFISVAIPGVAKKCYAGMTTWADGAPLSDHLEKALDSSDRARFYRRIGELIAVIHNQSSGWEAPAEFARPRLDLDGLLGEAPRWGRFWEHPGLTDAERKSLRQARERIRARLIEYGETPDNFSLIHADLHPGNIIYNGEDLALIDFDDSAFGWHIYDFAAALIDARLSPGFDALCEAFVDGYREHRPLAERDADMLPDFLLLRGMAIIGWLYQRPEHSGADWFEELKDWVVREC